MNKKGFTLMELLAVIVILAVLALLVIPITTNLIKTSKQQAFKISVGQVSDNIYFHYTKDWLLEGMSEDKVFDFETQENLNLLTVSGQLPTGGSITINPQGKISINVNNGVYCAVKTIDDDSIQVGEIVNGTCELTGEEVDTCPYAIGYTWDFDYVTTGTDRSQEFTALCTGEYKLEVWGAQGGTNIGTNGKTLGGYGGYATGTIKLQKNQSIFVNVGQAGNNGSGTVPKPTVYNGGGIGDFAGGGATHIALESGILSTFSNKQDKLLIVAGGGGGDDAYMGWENSSKPLMAGSGGGFKGGNSGFRPGYGGTQTAGGAGYQNGSFGQGGNSLTNVNDSSGAGGGGYYGGGSGYDGSWSDGGGGSGYIANPLLEDKHMYCFNCATSPAEQVKTLSNGEDSCFDENPVSDCAKLKNGYAKITYIGKKNSNTTYAVGDTFLFDFKKENNVGVIQELTIPVSGKYKLEVWGARGGSGCTNTGGYGGYSVGEINLTANTTLYIGVGSAAGNGSYNGGGSGGPSGGGATHIAFVNGQLKDLSSYKDSAGTNKSYEIIIVAGGGGGSDCPSNQLSAGNGGGYIGGTSNSSPGYGGSQSSGGSGYQSGSFGKGGDSCTSCSDQGGAGGGGWYGGGSGSGYSWSDGGGGSGYIANPFLTNKYMKCLDCSESNDFDTKTIKITDSNNKSLDAISDYAKDGNGYARITLLEIK